MSDVKEIIAPPTKGAKNTAGGQVVYAHSLEVVTFIRVVELAIQFSLETFFIAPARCFGLYGNNMLRLGNDTGLRASFIPFSL